MVIGTGAAALLPAAVGAPGAPTAGAATNSAGGSDGGHWFDALDLAGQMLGPLAAVVAVVVGLHALIALRTIVRRAGGWRRVMLAVVLGGVLAAPAVGLAGLSELDAAGRPVSSDVAVVHMAAGGSDTPAPMSSMAAVVEPTAGWTIVGLPGDTVRALAAGLGTSPEQLRAQNPGRGLPSGDDSPLTAQVVLDVPDDSRILRDGMWATQDVDDRRGLSGIAARFRVPGDWAGLAGEPRNAARLDGRDENVIFVGEPWVIPGLAEQWHREQEREGREQLDEIERHRMLEQQRQAEQDWREAQEAHEHDPTEADSSDGAPPGRTVLVVLVVLGAGMLVVHASRRLGQLLRDRLARLRTRLVRERVAATVARITQVLGSPVGSWAWDQLLVADALLREAQEAVRRAPGDAFEAAKLVGAQQARDDAVAALAGAAGDAIWDAVLVGVPDSAIARALGRTAAEVSMVTRGARAALAAPVGQAPRPSWHRWGARRTAERKLIADLAAAADPLEALRERLATYRGHVEREWAEVVLLVQEAVVWMLHDPRVGAVRGEALRERVARELGLPRAWVDSIVADPDVPVDNPPGVGYLPDRRWRVGTDLPLVRERLQHRLDVLGRALAKWAEYGAEWAPALDAHRGAVALAVRAAIDSGVPEEVVARMVGIEVDRARQLEHGTAAAVEGSPPFGILAGDAVASVAGGARPNDRDAAHPIRGPPRLTALIKGGIRLLWRWLARWLPARRALRREVRAQKEACSDWESARDEVESALETNRRLRAQLEQLSGGLLAMVTGAATGTDTTALARSNAAVRRARDARDQAWADYLSAVAPAVRSAASKLPHRVVGELAGLDWETVAQLVGRAEPDPGERFDGVDGFTHRWWQFWRFRHPAPELVLPGGRTISQDWLAVDFRSRTGDELALVMVVDGRIVGLGPQGLAVFDAADGHFHPRDYADSRRASTETFLRSVVGAGIQGPITFHSDPAARQGVGDPWVARSVLPGHAQ